MLICVNILSFTFNNHLSSYAAVRFFNVVYRLSKGLIFGFKTSVVLNPGGGRCHTTVMRGIIYSHDGTSIWTNITPDSCGEPWLALSWLSVPSCSYFTPVCWRGKTEKPTEGANLSSSFNENVLHQFLRPPCISPASSLQQDKALVEYLSGRMYLYYMCHAKLCVVLG